MGATKEQLREALKNFFDARNMSNPTLQDQQVVAASWGMKKEFVEMVKEDRAKDRNRQTMADRERRNQKFSEFDLRLAADYAKRNNVAVDGRNQEVVIHLAKSEYAEQLAAAEAAREAGRQLQADYEKQEAARWKKLLTEPYPATGPGKDMMAWNLERLDDATLTCYETSFKAAELRDLLTAAIGVAEAELAVAFDKNQRSFMAKFMNAQNPPLDPAEAQNWIVAYKILELEGASEELPTVKIDLSVPAPPPLPAKADGPVNPFKAGTLEAQQWERDELRRGVDAEIDAVVGPHLQEIANDSGLTIPASLAQAVVADLQAKQLAPTRYNIRRSFAYLRNSEIPAGVYSQDELDQFKRDEEERLMSAEDYKKLTYRRRA